MHPPQLPPSLSQGPTRAHPPGLPEVGPAALALLDLLGLSVLLLKGARVLHASPGLASLLDRGPDRPGPDSPLDRLLGPASENLEQLEAWLASNPEGSALPPLELTLVTRASRRLKLKVNSTPVLHQGAPARLLRFEDASELHALRQDLAKAGLFESLGRLAAGVAHDLNSLLAVIQGNAELLASSGEASAPHQAPHLRQILDAAGRSAAMVERILSFSRRGFPDPRPVRLEGLVRALIPLLQPVLGDHIRVIEDFSPDTEPVLADPSMMEQVIMNLVLNARDAMPEGGVIRLVLDSVTVKSGGSGAVAPGRYTTLSVQDEGRGMDPETAAQAPNPFFSTKLPGMGTGLGLPTVIDILRHHRGILILDSRLGRGTRATAWIPTLASPTPDPAHPRSRGG